MAAGLAVALARDGMPFRKAHASSARWWPRRRRAAARCKASARSARVGSARGGRGASTRSSTREAVKAKSLVGGAAPDAVRASLDAALARLGPWPQRA